MRRQFLIALALATTTLAACGSKTDVVENGSAAENLSFESTPANDASALEAVEAEDSKVAVPGRDNELESDNEVDSNADANASANSAGNSD
jgi:hypothetical protein